MGDAPTIHCALAAVMDDVKAVAKGDRNTQQNFSFRGIDAVVNAVGPALRKHGVIVVPEVVDHQYGEILVGQGNNRRPIAHVMVKVRYTFHGPAGDCIAAVTLGEAMDSGDKAVPKAMSVAFRVALLQALALPTDEKDPDEDVYERSAAPPPPPPPDPLTVAMNNAKRAFLATGVEGTDQEKATAFQERYVEWAGSPLNAATVDDLNGFTEYLKGQAVA